MKNLRIRTRFSLPMTYLAATILTIVWCSPIVWSFLGSLKSPMDVFAYPPVFMFTPTLKNYYYIFNERSFINFLTNSMIVGTGSTTVVLVVSCFAGYAFARFKFSGSKNILFWIFSIRMFPPIASIIPLFIIMKTLMLLDTHFGLIIAHSVINIPLAVWILRGYFMEIPLELEEAAKIDGCASLQVLRHIVLPLAIPGLVSAAMLSFAMSWNEFLFAIILTGLRVKTLPVGITGFWVPASYMWGPILAGSVISILPPLVLVAFLQKHIVRGLTFGAIK